MSDEKKKKSVLGIILTVLKYAITLVAGAYGGNALM